MSLQHHSRRHWLKLANAGVLAAFAKPKIARAQTESSAPDLVVVNATVHTVEEAAPRAEAFAVLNGRFTAVGASSDVRSLSGKRTQIYDARGMTVVPGFIDTHNHATGNVLLFEVLAGNPFEVEFVSIANIVEKLQVKAAVTGPGYWVEGYFFDDTKLKDGRALNIYDLDRVSKDHPVAVHHRGGHTTFYNSKAFELAGITKDTPNPPGGTFDRDANGELSGRVTDNANGVMARAGKRQVITEQTRQQRDRMGLAHISKQFVRYGLTSVHHEGGNLAALQEVRERGELLHRVSYEASGRALDDMISSGIRSGFGDEWIRLGATSEHTIDGSFSERTMALSTPYPGSNPPYKGNITTTQADLNAWIERVHRAGIQVNCHANGDVAIDMFLTAVERAQKAAWRDDARPKITHCTLVNDDLIGRIKALGAVPSLFTTYAYYNSDKFAFYGEEMMKHSMAYRSLLDAGIVAAAGSDFSPGPFDPRMALQGMSTRKGWDGKTWGANQRITLEEALRVNTLNGAYNSHEEKIKGSISAGKLADFVVLAEDPFTVAADKIKDIAIVRTVVGGKVVYAA